jgi:hypothetical protein
MKNQQAHRTIRPRTRSAKLVTTMLAAMFFSATPLHSVLAENVAGTDSVDSFAVLGGTAVTLTDSTVIGDVGSPVAVTVTTSTVVGTVYPAGDPVVLTAYSDFLTRYDALAFEQCDSFLTGDLAGLVLTPGVYCIEAASTTTNGTLTLDAQGDASANWLFKIGTGGTGALTGTGFSVVMDNGGQPCNVSWWVAEAVTMSASSFKGNILAGADTTFTGGSLIGQVLAQAGVTMTGTDVFACSKLDAAKDKSCGRDHDKKKDRCNQGVGNGPEGCDPGRSNHGDDSNSNDEEGGTPGHPGRKGHDD